MTKLRLPKPNRSLPQRHRRAHAELFRASLSFWIQMERLEARGAPFKAIYLRRAAILLGLGLVHLLALFNWDILHIYGITDRFYDEAAAEASVLARQAAAQSGDFGAFLSSINADYVIWFLSGGLLGWILYALGRFFMGAWVARRGWIQNARDHLPGYRRWLWPLLVVGLLLELTHLLTDGLPEDTLFGQIELLRTVLHVVATPLIAAGYICAIVLLFHGRSLSWLVKPFAPVGQMALTNYLTQSVAIILILTSVGPGLGLAGNAGISTFLPLVVVFFAAQIVISFFWMKTFAFGPAEWLWRALTYGTRPRFRRVYPASAQ